MSPTIIYNFTYIAIKIAYLLATSILKHAIHRNSNGNYCLALFQPCYDKKPKVNFDFIVIEASYNINTPLCTGTIHLLHFFC